MNNVAPPMVRLILACTELEEYKIGAPVNMDESYFTDDVLNEDGLRMVGTIISRNYTRDIPENTKVSGIGSCTTTRIPMFTVNITGNGRTVTLLTAIMPKRKKLSLPESIDTDSDRFAFKPTVIKLSTDRRALIWLKSYKSRISSTLPTLCECYEQPCEHSGQHERYNAPADGWSPSWWTLEWYVVG